MPSILTAVTWGGAAFLCAYALKSFYSAFRPQHLDQKAAKGLLNDGDVRKTVGVLLALSLLNPHVYLDTVVLLGGIGASYEGDGRYIFGAGAITASLIF